MSVKALKTRFDNLFSTLNKSTINQFSKIVESGYQALVLAHVMAEYARVKKGVLSVTPPRAGYFLSHTPGRFDIAKSFKIDFLSGECYYFAADVEIFGLTANRDEQGFPSGVLFDVDVVVVTENSVGDINTNFYGYPAPQHIDSVYDCKFGKYHKAQLRELLGLRRHVSLLLSESTTHASKLDNTKIFDFHVMNAQPSIGVKIARPRLLNFFDVSTASLFDLQQIKI